MSWAHKGYKFKSFLILCIFMRFTDFVLILFLFYRKQCYVYQCVSTLHAVVYCSIKYLVLCLGTTAEYTITAVYFFFLFFNASCCYVSLFLVGECTVYCTPLLETQMLTHTHATVIHTHIKCTSTY